MSVSVLSSVPSCVCLSTVSQCRPVSVSVLSLSAVLCLSQYRPVSVSVLSLSAVLCLSQYCQLCSVASFIMSATIIVVIISISIIDHFCPVLRCSLLSSRLIALMSHVHFTEYQYPFIAFFFFFLNFHRSGVLTELFGSYMAGAT